MRPRVLWNANIFASCLSYHFHTQKSPEFFFPKKIFSGSRFSLLYRFSHGYQNSRLSHKRVSRTAYAKISLAILCIFLIAWQMDLCRSETPTGLRGELFKGSLWHKDPLSLTMAWKGHSIDTARVCSYKKEGPTRDFFSFLLYAEKLETLFERKERREREREGERESG